MQKCYIFPFFGRGLGPLLQAGPLDAFGVAAAKAADLLSNVTQIFVARAQPPLKVHPKKKVLGLMVNIGPNGRGHFRPRSGRKF